MTKLFHAEPLAAVGAFWWVFALRGAFALLFSIVLFAAGSLFRVFFLDPFILALLGLLLGFYVMANGLILGVAAIVAEEHGLAAWFLFVECVVVILLGCYIGFTLLLTPQSLALLAGVHAVVAGGFQCVRGLKLKDNRRSLYLLSGSGVISVVAGVVFLLNQGASTRNITNWLAGLELFYGALSILFALGLYKSRAPKAMAV